jgi:hypothetical protein
MTSKLKTDVLETVSGSGTIALTNQLSGMTSASVPTGSVLQVVSASADPATTSTTSVSYVSTGQSLAITLSSSSNKVLVSVSGGTAYCGVYNGGMIETICRQTSATYSQSNDLAGSSASGFTEIYNGSATNAAPHSMSVLDTPNTINPTYQIFFRSRITGRSVLFHDAGHVFTITLMEIKG